MKIVRTCKIQRIIYWLLLNKLGHTKSFLNDYKFANAIVGIFQKSQLKTNKQKNCNCKHNCNWKNWIDVLFYLIIPWSRQSKLNWPII